MHLSSTTFATSVSNHCGMIFQSVLLELPGIFLISSLKGVVGIPSSPMSERRRKLNQCGCFTSAIAIPLYKKNTVKVVLRMELQIARLVIVSS